MSYGGTSFEYDNAGNPTYGSFGGYTVDLEWENGRQLSSIYAYDEFELSFTYNDEGIRTSKNSDGTIHYYTLAGDMILSEEWMSGATQYLLLYHYDANGHPIGMSFRRSTYAEGVYDHYLFIKNILGDITGVMDEEGNILVTYAYDAWGNHISTVYSNGGGATGARFNPFRYRGYYYDTETCLYYLNSRYYDPASGRFINPDSASYIGADGTLIGYNLFAYCGNNPVMGYDPTGHWDWGTFFSGVGLLSTGISALAISITILACPAAAPIMVAVAAMTAIAGGLTAVNGIAEIIEAGTDYNVIRDGLMDGNTQAYELYRDITSTVAEIGTIICGSYYAAKGGNVCFVAGTMILTAAGHITIEAVKAGDWVWATDPETGETELKQVVQTFVNESTELVRITVNGEEIVCTTEHPFYSPVKGWIAACKLRAGDILVMLNGEYVVVEQVQHELLETPITVYNFEVEGFHTYYVGDTGVLVHNRCNGKWSQGTFDTPEQSIDYHYFKHGTEVSASTRDQYIKKATDFANRVLKKGTKSKYVGGATPNTYRYIFNNKYIDLSWNGVEHIIVSFGKVIK